MLFCCCRNYKITLACVLEVAASVLWFSDSTVNNCTIFFLLLYVEEYDEYDAEFDKMREANLMTRGVQAKEELTDVHAKVEECRGNLAHARDQVGI